MILLQYFAYNFMYRCMIIMFNFHGLLFGIRFTLLIVIITSIILVVHFGTYSVLYYNNVCRTLIMMH